MSIYLVAALVLVPASAIPIAAQAVAPGRWDITTTIVNLSVPGVPGFIERLVRGKSKAEHKRLPAPQGMEALLAPDPKARCHVDSQRIADGRYAQALTCPQKRGEPVHIARTGTYDAAGFAGLATLNGTTPKGPMSIVMSQRAARVGD